MFTMPSAWVVASSTKRPWSETPEMTASKVSPTLGAKNSTCFILIEARSASAAATSRSEACTASRSKSAISSCETGAPPAWLFTSRWIMRSG